MEERNAKLAGNGQRENPFAHRLAHLVIVYLTALLLALPLFIIIDAFVPELVLPLGEGLRVDQLLVFVAVVGAFVVLVRRFQYVMYGALMLGLLVISFTTITGLYPVSTLYNSYAQFLRDLRETASGVPMAADRLKPFHDADKLRSLVDVTDPAVRKASVQHGHRPFHGGVGKGERAHPCAGLLDLQGDQHEMAVCVGREGR